MNHTAKINEAARIIATEAINFLAVKHGAPFALVLAAFIAGDAKVCAQVRALVNAGIDGVMAMHDAGDISLA